VDKCVGQIHLTIKDVEPRFELSLVYRSFVITALACGNRREVFRLVARLWDRFGGCTGVPLLLQSCWVAVQ